MTFGSSLFSLFALLIATSGSSFASQPQPTPVAHVDVNRYLGVWYEIASIPQSFQKGCNCTRAVYSLMKEDQIRVINTCNKDSVNGKLKRARGRGYIVNRQTNSELEVGFFLPFIPAFRGDYWIVGLDEDYRYAVVSNREATTLWILSRTPVLAPELLERAYEIAEQNGISRDRIVPAVQAGCTYPEL